MNVSVEHAPVGSRTPHWLQVLALPVIVVALLAGLWFFGGVVAPGYNSSIALATAWFVAAYLGIRFGLRRLPAIKRPVQVTFLATALLVGGVFAWTTFRDVTVVRTSRRAA